MTVSVPPVFVAVVPGIVVAGRVVPGRVVGTGVVI